MIKKLIGTLALTVLFAANANAATLTLSGPTGDVMVGDEILLTLTGNFGEFGLIAGGITLFWDAGLVALNPDGIVRSFGANDFSCPGSAGCPPNTASSAAVVWGEFLNDLVAPNAGDVVMATISFTALSATSETLASFAMQDNPQLTGGWFGAGFAPIDVPDFVGTSVNVVPLPAAVWFMIGGLGTLLGFRRK